MAKERAIVEYPAITASKKLGQGTPNLVFTKKIQHKVSRCLITLQTKFYLLITCKKRLMKWCYLYYKSVVWFQTNVCIYCLRDMKFISLNLKMVDSQVLPEKIFGDLESHNLVPF